MKFTHMLAAALMVAGIGVSTEASAQRYDGAYNQEVRYDRHDRDRRWDRRDDRRSWGRHDRGRRYGWQGNRGRNHCRVVYRHGQRYTVCR